MELAEGVIFPEEKCGFRASSAPVGGGGPLGCCKRGNRLLNARSNLPTPAEGRRRKGAISFGNPRSWKPPGERHPAARPNEWRPPSLFHWPQSSRDSWERSAEAVHSGAGRRGDNTGPTKRFVLGKRQLPVD